MSFLTRLPRSRSTRCAALGSVCFGALLSACFAGPLPDDAILLCTAASDCPAPLTCAVEVGRCVSPELLASTGPALVGEASVEPAAAPSDTAVTVRFVVDQPLLQDPVVELEGASFGFALVPEESDVAAGSYVARATVLATAPAEGSHSVIASVVSTAGRPAVLRLGTLVVDRTPNQVVGVLAVGGVYGRGATATLALTLVEAVDADHEPQVFFVDEGGVTTESWTRADGDGTAFSFNYTVPDTPSLAEGPHEVRVVLYDNAGNATAPLPAGVVRIDLTPPAIAESSVSIEVGPLLLLLLGGPPSAAGPAAKISVLFSTDDDLVEAPLVSLVCPGGSVALARVGPGASLRYFNFTHTVARSTTPEGSCALQAEATDRAGNHGVLDLGTVVVDTTAPAPLVDDAGAGATLARAPWGATDLDGDGADDRGSMVLIDAPQEEGSVAVATEVLSDGILARATAGAPIDLGRLDRQGVMLSAVDAAGNESERRFVHQGLWVATLGDKRVDSLVENPHRAVAHRALPVAVDDGAGLEVAEELAAVDGSLAFAFAVPRWRRGPDADAEDLSLALASAAWDDARGVAFAFGGSSSGVASDDTWQWDGRTWSDLVLGGRPPARAGAAMAYDARRGVTVMFGGADIAGVPQDDTWELDGTWQERSVVGPPARKETQAAYDPQRGEVVLFGGRDLANNLLADTWTFDGETWTDRSSAGPAPRARAGMTYDELRGGVVMAGGLMSGGTLDDDLWLWDGDSWQVVPLTGTPPLISNFSVYEHRMAYDRERQAPVLFGMNSVQQIEMAVAAAGATAWEALPLPSGYRSATTLLYDPVRAELLISGGESASATEVLGSGATVWADPGAHPLVQNHHAAVFDPRTGTVLFAAGRSAAGTRRTDTWASDGQRFRNLTSAVLPALDDMAAFTRSIDAFLFGGVVTGTGYVNTVRRFNGTSWVTVTTSGTAPTARGDSAAVLEVSSNTVVVFGGNTGAAQGDTFRFNGTAWTPLAISGPSARYGHAMAWDDNHQAVVLYGGDNDDNVYNGVRPDTWRFQAGTWTDVSALVGSGPGGRVHHQMATDPSTGEPLLYSGIGANGARDNTLWALGDDGWYPVVAGNGPATVEHGAMVADPMRQHVMLHGGVQRDDTWVLDRAWHGQPALSFHVDLNPLGLSATTLEDVEVLATAGGEGVDPDLGALNGATLHAWSVGRYQALANHSAPPGTPALLSSGPLAAADVALGGRAIHVAVASRGKNGLGDADVTLDHIEVRVHYYR